MNVETTLETNAQFTETGKLRMRALDYPAIPAEPLLTFHATAADTGRDAALPQVTTAACKVIAFVRMQLARTFARLSVQARYRRNGIQRALECHRIVPVGTRDRDGQRNAARIYDDVPFRPELAPVCRVGAVSWPPGAGNTGGIKTRPFPVNLVMLTQAAKH
ncbi:hypothetical protein SAMN05421548_15910, partial [Paraburkholderia lycopersici]